MPPLKETRSQIKERTAREIRNRTAIRLAQLRTQFVETEREREEDSDEEDVVDESCVGTRSVWVRLCCFLLFLFLCLCLNATVSTMPRTKITPAFKAPRLVTGQEGSSGKDEAEVPLVTRRRHRKDNSEWDKRMEKEFVWKFYNWLIFRYD
jgi:hypothetical protein